MGTRSKKNLKLFIACCLLCSACKSNVKSETNLEKSSTASLSFDSKIDSFFNHKFPPNEPGGAVLVLRGDKLLISKGYGISNIQTNQKVTPQTLFNLGSVSKTFVSNAILILQSNGKLSVDDSLIMYFPEFQNTKIARSVQIKHLLTHTSGLPDIRYPWKDSVFYLTAKDQENWAPIMKTTRLNFEPGSQFEYSNPAFNALALIIEKVSGEKWQQFVSKTILNPSGMNTSTITDGSHPASGVAHGYIKVKNSWVEKDYGEEPTFAAAGNGGVWSSVEELALYEEALRKNVFLASAIQEEATSIKRFSNWRAKEDPFIGWSWFIGRTKDGYKTIGHTGSQGGFRSDYFSVPDKKWLIVILSSSPHPLEDYTRWILNHLESIQ